MELPQGSMNGYKETLVYLDFNDKISHELLDDKIFIRVANLEDKNPLVQVNDMVFKGSYDYSIGTNLFFKKTSNEGPREFPFQRSNTFKLEFLSAQTKTLNCKQMRVPPTIATLPKNNENIHYNFKWDYHELLDKFENGTLDLNDMMREHHDDEPSEEITLNETCEEQNVELNTSNEPTRDENVEMSEHIKNIDIQVPEEPYPELKVAYEDLMMLARRPVKRKHIAETVEIDPKYSSSYEYKSIECKVLEPPPFSCMKNSDNLEKYDISDCVDINRCTRLGIIGPSNNFPRILTENEKKMVFTIENFENLSLTARYSVLLSHMEELEKLVNSNTFEENAKKDEFGHTPLETLEIFKKLLLSLKRRIKKVS